MRVPYNLPLYSIIYYYCTPILFLSPILSNKNILTRIGVAWRACENLNIGNVLTFIISVNFVSPRNNLNWNIIRILYYQFFWYMQATDA